MMYLKKTYILIVLLFIFSIQLFSGEIYSYTDNWGDNGLNLLDQNSSNVTLNFSIEVFSLNKKIISNDTLHTIGFSETFLPNDEGAPNVPSISRYIAIPQNAEVQINIVNSQHEVISNVDLAPAHQIPIDSSDEPLVYDKNMDIYSNDELYPQAVVRVSEPSKMRGVDVVKLAVSPFQYNPVTKELKVNRNLKVEVQFVSGNGHFGVDKLRSRWWEPVWQQMLVNYESLPEVNYNNNYRNNDYEYLIIIPDNPIYYDWADTLQQFRTNQGINTGVVTLAQIGGNDSNSIENYINGLDPYPAAILFMADYGTGGVSGNGIFAPVFDSWCISDNFYADVDGDQLPDIATARMTAQTEDQLAIMVSKVIDNERTPPTNPDFYQHPITALGWQTERWFQICSETIGGFWSNELGKNQVRINEVNEGNPNSDPWSTATNTNLVLNYFGPSGEGYIPASPSTLGGWYGGTATDVNNAINSGAFMLQHRDHGSVTGWGEPDYDIGDLGGLDNSDLVTVFSINCLTGQFDSGSECFAEAMHRHEQRALGIVAATTSSYSFVNDTYVWGMYDYFWPDFMPTFGANPPADGNILPAFGNVAGKYFLNSSNWPYNTSSKSVTYYLFHWHGGAFSSTFIEMPQNLTVSHRSALPSEADEFSVTADCDALISLTVGDEIIGIGEGNSNFPTTISIPPQSSEDTMLVTVTKQNYYRYEQEVEIVPSGFIIGEISISGGETNSRPVEDAKIKIISSDHEYEVNPNSNGEYSSDIPVGTYDVYAILPGYDIKQEDDVEVTYNNTAEVNFDLNYNGTILVSQAPLSQKLSHFQSIGLGIDNSMCGETVKVYNGTYTGPCNRNLTWNGNEKHITVMSVNGPDNCIIDGEDSSNSCFEFDLEDITTEDVINGFTIKDFNGSAITSNEGCPTIVNNNIVNCREYSIKGAAVNIDCDCYCAIINNEFINCDINNGLSTWSAEGGAIRCKGDGWIKNNNFSECTLKGIIDDGNQWTPEDVKDKGGAIWFDNSDLKISDNSFSNCFADEGGAIYADDAGYINNNVINSCSALQGGAIFSIGEANIESNTISNCVGEHYDDETDGFGGDGAGIYVLGPAYIANNIIHDNFGSINGVGISGRYSSGVEIVNNEFYGNEQNGENMSCFLFGVSMALEGDDIIVSGNKIHNEKSYDSMDMIYVSGYNITVKNNVIYDNTNSDVYNRAAIGCSGSYEFDPDSINIVNNTIVNNKYGIYCDYSFETGDLVKVKNNIIIDNFTGIKDNSNIANIQYCNVFNNNTDYQGCSPGTSCISTEPMFADSANDDYSLTWDSNDISPCIDAGDPDMTWDADDTPPDMGAITSTSHSYFTNQFDNGVIDSVEWISFPALNTITDSATEALFVLENQELIDDDPQTDDILDYLLYKDDPVIYFDEAETEWQNDLGNFHSYQGYKMQLRDNNDSIRIGITGMWDDASEPIQLYANQANWIGCYLEEPAAISEAFSSIEDEWISIKSEHWAVHRQINDWNSIRGTVNPGELYIVQVDMDCELIWDDSGTPVDPYTRENTDYFTYDKKLDYMAITVDTVYGDDPDEIAAYSGGECLGASKVDGEYPVQILAYPPDAGSKDGSIDFMLYNYNSKDKAKAVTNYTVYNTKFSAYVNKPVYFSQKNYKALRLNTGENIDPDLDFALFGNYPNPIQDDVTHISFAPAKDADETEIKIYNVRGQLIRKLDCSKAKYNKAGIPTVSWDCKDSRGKKVQSSVYFYKLISGKKQAVSKMVIVK